MKTPLATAILALASLAPVAQVDARLPAAQPARADTESRDAAQNQAQNQAQKPGDTDARAAARAERWRDDLALLTSRLPEVHPDFFHATPASDFEAAADELDAKLAEFDDARVQLELARLVAMGRDSHTGLDLREMLAGSPGLPVRFIALADGVFIHAAAGGKSDLIGARLVDIEGVPIDEVLDRASAYFAWENEPKRLHTAPEYARSIPVLLASGVIDEKRPETITVTVERDEWVREIELRPLRSGAKIRWRSWVDTLERMPLAVRRSTGFYQSDFIPDADRSSGVMYVAYNRCEQAKDLSFVNFTRFVMTKADELNARRIVIDLRQNPGGNESVIMPMLTMLDRSPRFDEPGSIVVLIGRRTYSSAMSNAITLRGLGATLIGEPTGGKPNHFGEIRSFALPRSRLRVYHSTRYWDRVADNPDSLEPDVLTPMTSVDLFAGKDAALSAALRHQHTRAEVDTDAPDTP